MTDIRQRKLEAARDATIKKFGDKSSALANIDMELNVVPSPSLMLDYKLGIGGFPYGHMVEVFGANGLGKTSALGYGTLANVQRQGKLPALIAMEPSFDKDWAMKLHGLNPDLLLIQWPDNAEQAFEMIHDLVYGGLVDYILVDSIGAMAAESETREGGGKKAFGISGIVTSGLNDIMPRLYKNNQGLMIINQQRQDTKKKAQPGTTFYESPGGEALKHHAMIRIQLKPGKERFTAKFDGEDVLIGRELICSFRKNKLAQAANKKAGFNFFHIDTDDYGLGVDKTTDILNTAKITGVVEAAGAWLRHDAFPEGKLNGKNALAKFLRDNPEIESVIRNQVMERMMAEEIAAAKENAEKKAEGVEVVAVGDTDEN